MVNTHSFFINLIAIQLSISNYTLHRIIYDTDTGNKYYNSLKQVTTIQGI